MNPVDTVAAVSHSPAGNTGGLFSLDPGVMIWTWVVFGLVLVILRKYAWTPLISSVNERERIMREAVENAEKTRLQLESIATRQEQMLKEATEQAREIIRGGRARAEQAAGEIAEKARAEAGEILREGRERMIRERDEAIDEFKRRAVDVVIGASEQLLATGLSDENHRDIVERRIEEL